MIFFLFEVFNSTITYIFLLSISEQVNSWYIFYACQLGSSNAAGYFLCTCSGISGFELPFPDYQDSSFS